MPLVYADRDRLIQILHNLIQNSVKYTEKGSITVKAHSDGGFVFIAVVDTGIGISAENLVSIFEPFERVGSAVEKHSEGVGLGLPIVKRLVELHGGAISVTSEPGQGSTFEFSIPVWENGENLREPLSDVAPTIRENISPVKTLVEERIESLSVSNRASGRKILVVDDDMVNLEVVKNYFSDTGYEISCANNGGKALGELRRCHYDLVLLDMMMPDISGLEVCNRVRKQKNLSAIPVIMVTARSYPDDIADAFKAGANDYITKPFSKKELLARVEAQLSIRAAYLAEVKALQAQIRPHFFFNAINSIVCQCDENPTQVKELLVNMGLYLRRCLNYNEEFIPLREELRNINAYLSLEQARLKERLNVVINTEGCDHCVVPALILEPLVENAVQHGIFPKVGGGTVSITCRRQGKHFLFAVKDDGVGMSPEKISEVFGGISTEKTGMGIVNVHDRLCKLYGSGLEIDSQEDQGTSISFKIPVQINHEGESRA
jgi:LytS/YehU family sensor histidine kinase